MTGLNKAITVAGSQKALAKAIGLGQSAVANWLKRGGLVPVEYCASIEIAFSGAVTRKDLRPDDWEMYWPELAASESANSDDISIKVNASSDLTADPSLEADLVKAEQAGLVVLPKKAPVWDGIERRKVVRRAVDRALVDIAIAGQGA
ncbi:MAG: helix-turn-helix domain-containing protein [Polaromonas sp.]|nr:helix-turn-helix domain-containing protein [Polaromonas sp.]